mmetsp:Transcript_21047/g.30398  ORF Transcript_21047/g.30398 Transcript_21047/m.30398 type:complete len:795 (-) Transcript_21047:201-2585(-)
MDSSSMENGLITSLCIFILGVYVATLSPSIAGGDSGELVAEGCILGTAHPPGYPLLTVIVNLISYIPFKSVAYRVNFLSALLSAVAAWCLAKTVAISSKSRYRVFGGIFSAGTFAFSPLIWQYAVTAEVFPLNTMFAALICYCTFLFAQQRDPKISMFGALVCGLALCNQHTIILFEVPLIIWMMFLLRHSFLHNFSLLAVHGGLFLLGLSFYLYLPISGFLSPKPGSWGHVTDISGFVHHFLRRDYGTFQLFSGNAGKKTEGFSERTEAYMMDAIGVQGLYIVPILALLALLIVCMRTISHSRESKETKKISIAVVKSKKKVTSKGAGQVSLSHLSPTENETNLISMQEASYTQVVLVCTYIFYFIVFHSLSNLPLDNKLLYGVHQRFWMQPNVLLFIFGGMGFIFVFDWIDAVLCGANTSQHKKRKDEGISEKSIVVPSHCYVLRIVAMCLALGAILYQLRVWYPISDQSDAYHFRNYASALLSPLPNNSVLLINYDMQWTSVRYMQACEGIRPDVTVINLSMMTYQWFQHKRSLYPHLSFPGAYHSYESSEAVKSKLAFTLSQFIEENIAEHPIFLSGKLSFRDTVFESSYELVPYGLVSRVFSQDNVPSGIRYTSIVRESWKAVRSALPSLPDEAKYPEETWEWTIGRDYKDRLTDTAAFYLEVALKTASQDYRPLVNAVYWLESAVYYEGGEVHGNPSAALLKNTGLAHVNLIQNKLFASDKALPRPMNDILGSLEGIGWPVSDRWKTWSTERFIETWGQFLNRAESKSDPQIETIRQMYRKATSIKST